MPPHAESEPWLMRWKKFPFVHNWRRKKKKGSDSPGQKRASPLPEDLGVDYQEKDLGSHLSIDKSPKLLRLTPELPEATFFELNELSPRIKNAIRRRWFFADLWNSSGSIEMEMERNAELETIPLPEELEFLSKISVVKEMERDAVLRTIPIPEELKLSSKISIVKEAEEKAEEQINPVPERVEISNETVEENCTMEQPKAQKTEISTVEFKMMPKEIAYADFKVALPPYEAKVQKPQAPDLGESLETEILLSKIRAKKSSTSGASFASAVIRDEREREKRQIAALNDLFAACIEKARFYEADNGKITSDLRMLREYKGPIQMFIKEIAEARKLGGETDIERLSLEKQHAQLGSDYADEQKGLTDLEKLEKYERRDIDNLIVKLCEIQHESNLLKHRIHESEDQVMLLRQKNLFFNELLNAVYKETAQEKLVKLQYQNELDAYYAELELVKRQQDQEIEDLKADIMRQTADSHREHFKNVLADAIHQVRKEHEERLAADRKELDFWYKIKLQEIQLSVQKQTTQKKHINREVEVLRTEYTTLRDRSANYEDRNYQLKQQISRLNDQLKDEQRKFDATLGDRDAMISVLYEEYDGLVTELQHLLETKQDLEQEIIIYRNLLNKTGTWGLPRVTITSKVQTAEVQECRLNESGETTSKITFQESAKGNLSIKDVAVDGRYVMVENTSESKEEPLEGWKIRRKIDSGSDIVYTFPKDLVLKPLRTVKIWAKDRGGLNNPPDHLIFDDITTFGMGLEAKTTLENTEGEERAIHEQKTSQTTIIYK